MRWCPGQSDEPGVRGFTSSLRPCLAVWPSASHFTSVCPNFLNHRMKIKQHLHPKVDVRIKWESVCKVLSPVLAGTRYTLYKCFSLYLSSDPAEAPTEACDSNVICPKSCSQEWGTAWTPKQISRLQAQCDCHARLPTVAALARERMLSYLRQPENHQGRKGSTEVRKCTRLCSKCFANVISIDPHINTDREVLPLFSFYS